MPREYACVASASSRVNLRVRNRAQRSFDRAFKRSTPRRIVTTTTIIMAQLAMVKFRFLSITFTISFKHNDSHQRNYNRVLFLFQFVMAVFLSSQVLADIIVQPGYEHTAQQRVVTQPPETVRQQDNQQQQDRQQERYVDPGYHLELHPVYRNSYHVPSYAVLPISQTGTFPPMSKATYKRLLSSLGEITEVPAIVPAQYYQYLPPVSRSLPLRSIISALTSR